MCFSGGGGSGSSARNARNAQLSVQRRQVSTSSIDGYDAGGWGDAKTGKELVAVTPAAVGRVLPQTAGNMSDAQLTQQIRSAQSSQFKNIRESVMPKSNINPMGGGQIRSAQGSSGNYVPNDVYADASGKVLTGVGPRGSFADGSTRKSYAAKPNIVVKDGKSFYEYTTTTQTYKAGGFTSSPDNLNRQRSPDPSAALRATRRSRGAGVKITQGNSITRANRGGGLRIDTSGVNASSNKSGVNIG